MPNINDESTERANRKFRDSQRREAARVLEKARHLILDAGVYADRAEDGVLQQHVTALLASVDDAKDLTTEAVGR